MQINATISHKMIQTTTKETKAELADTLFYNITNIIFTIIIMFIVFTSFSPSR